jgi:hypothetical protein
MRWGCQSIYVLYVQFFLPIIRNGCLFNACMLTQGKFGDVTCQLYLTKLGAFSHMLFICTICTTSSWPIIVRSKNVVRKRIIMRTLILFYIFQS